MSFFLKVKSMSPWLGRSVLCLAAFGVMSSPAYGRKNKKSSSEVEEARGNNDAVAEEVEEPDGSEKAIELIAEEPIEDGIWEWVERMEDEVPSEEQVQAILEMNEEESAEKALIDELTPITPGEEVYTDPQEAVAADPLHLDKVDPSEFDIPVVVNDDVRKWVAYFTGPVGRKYFARWLNRSSRYRPMMYAELEKKGLPKDLVYLSMIESGYNAHAYSHAHAAGLWQFIPSTARLYKLRVDWWVDDRRDPGDATRAGTDFLAELHQMFDDWYLAFAGYNGGPGRVRRAVANSGSRDFWTIAHGKHLHS
ncbi:MAG: transglycosylase SLT domain-containing protein, partial [Proteobacteria bacterium]|nr:transglycosylase SLT domain-containing protein [Pseudomonadota bacterium]